jgi:hypothetical protein
MMTVSQYIDARYQNANVTPQETESQDAFGADDLTSRAAALRKIAESNSVKGAEFNAAFVLLQGFSYLRRNPLDPPDKDDSGYQLWLGNLSSFNGDYIKFETVRSFIASAEYRQRFGKQ